MQHIEAIEFKTEDALDSQKEEFEMALDEMKRKADTQMTNAIQKISALEAENSALRSLIKNCESHIQLLYFLALGIISIIFFATLAFSHKSKSKMD